MINLFLFTYYTYENYYKQIFILFFGLFLI